MSTAVSDKVFLEKIPSRAQSAEAFYVIINSGEIESNRMSMIKSLVGFNDTVISHMLNIDVKTFRNYTSTQKKINKNLQERVVMLLSFIKHGLEYFGSSAKFNLWLNAENFYLDHKRPSEYMDTINGLVILDTMLTNMEYGNNA